MRRVAAIVLALCLAPSVGRTEAFPWGHYSNAQYGYEIDIPPEFSPVEQSGGGDGGVSTARDKLSKLAVWGSMLVDEKPSDEFAERLAATKADGWTISYSRVAANWASWSGSQQGRIFYARAIRLCDDQIAFFLFEYPRARLESYRPFVERLVKSLKNARSC